jgi:hypothetical protein
MKAAIIMNKEGSFATIKQPEAVRSIDHWRHDDIQ